MQEGGGQGREQKEIIFFFSPCTSEFHWDSDFTGSHGASATAGAALLQRTQTMWAVSCAEIP